MIKDQELITKLSSQKAVNVIELVEASLNHLKRYDEKKQYPPKERELYDVLSDRFIRAVEISLKFFGSYEKLMFGENSETLRDLLNRMGKCLILIDTMSLSSVLTIGYIYVFFEEKSFLQKRMKF